MGRWARVAFVSFLDVLSLCAGNKKFLLAHESLPIGYVMVDSIFVPAASEHRLPDDLVRFLGEKGFGSSSVLEAALDKGDQDSADSLLEALEAPIVRSRLWSSALMIWMDHVGEAAAKRHRKLIVCTNFADRALLVDAAATAAKREILDVLDSAVNLCIQPRVWRTRRQKELSEADTLSLRADIEKRERDRWLAQVISIIMEANLPVVAFAALATSAELAMKYVAGCRRAKTLRTRVRTWNKVRSWLSYVHSTVWPRHAGQMVDYVQDLVIGDCGKTVPRAVFLALYFFETAGAVTEDPISSNRLWVSYINGVETEIKERRKAVVNKAPPLSLKMVISLELAVMSGRPCFAKVLAWLRLVKVWSCLRFNDHCGISPGSLRLTPGGLRGVIEVSKTTGPSKKAGHVPFFVHRHAGFSGHDWLKTGFDILASEPFSFERDFLLPCPNGDMSGAIRKMADYSSVSSWNRAMLLDLLEPVFDASGVWVEKVGAHFIHSPGHLYWREHSERHVLSEWSASLGIEKSRRDFLGRWGVNSHGSNDYIACARMAVLGIHKEICEAISVGAESLDEFDLADSFRAFLVSRGLDEVDAHEQSKEILMPKVGDLYFGLGQDWPLSSFSEVQLVPPRVEGDDVLMTASIPVGEEAQKVKRDRKTFDEAPFWVSLTKKRRHRRLHRRGGCWLDPSVDCWDFEKIWSLDKVTVDAKCVNCFGKGLTPDASAGSAENTAEGDDLEERSSQESSSSDELETPGDQESEAGGAVAPQRILEGQEPEAIDYLRPGIVGGTRAGLMGPAPAVDVSDDWDDEL